MKAAESCKASPEALRREKTEQGLEAGGCTNTCPGGVKNTRPKIGGLKCKHLQRRLVEVPGTNPGRQNRSVSSLE